jgi:hypothetical protein
MMTICPGSRTGRPARDTLRNLKYLPYLPEQERFGAFLPSSKLKDRLDGFPKGFLRFGIYHVFNSS